MQNTSSPSKRKGLTLRAKMVLLSAAAFAGIIMVTAINVLLVHEVKIGGTAYKSLRNNMDALESIALLKSDLYQIHREAQNVLLESSNKNTGQTVSTITGLTNDIELNFGIVLESLKSKDKRDAISKADTIWLEYKKTLMEEIIPAAASGDMHKARILMAEIQTRRFNTFIKTVTWMVDNLRLEVNHTEETIADSIKYKIAIALAVTLIVVCLIALFSYIIGESITRSLRTCVEFARTVAGGQLDTRLKLNAGGETGALADAMNTMAENLQSMVSRVNSTAAALTAIDNNIEKTSRQLVTTAQVQETAVDEASEAVKHISESVVEITGGIDKLSSSASESSSSILQMAASIEEVAMGADKLGSSVEEVSSSIIEMAASIKEIGVNIVNLLDVSSSTASSVIEMDATTKQVERNAMDTAAISEGVKQDAETGKKAVEEAIAGMQAIRNSSRITADVIENLSHRANDIGAILSVIDEVAEQTNLLALNAAIIAAQAGEHGKGFAVVADEIRELAERTSSSTREIATVIQGVQDETHRAVAAINKAEESITEGEHLSQRSGVALEKIYSGVHRASIQVREIARATVEQAHGSQNIKEAMESVAEMVGHIAGSANEHAVSSELIAKAVERMKNLTVHVRISAREQSEASNLIASSTEDINALISQIRDVCRAQADSSKMIAGAVNKIKTSATSNTTAARTMKGSVTSLTNEIELLENELTVFKI